MSSPGRPACSTPRGRIRPGAYSTVRVEPTAVYLRYSTYLPAIFFAAHAADDAPRRFDRAPAGTILLPAYCWTAIMRGMALLEPAVVPASLPVTAGAGTRFTCKQ